MIKLNYIIGSPSDEEKLLPDVERAAKELGDVHVIMQYASAHRTPERVKMLLRGIKDGVLLSGAGMSNALSGVIAASVPIEVVNIGIPVNDPCWQGISSFAATAELPPGFPVLTVGVDNSYAGVQIAYRIMQERDRPLQIVIAKDKKASTEEYEKLLQAFEDLGLPYNKEDMKKHCLCISLADPNSFNPNRLDAMDKRVHGLEGSIHLALLEKTPVTREVNSVVNAFDDLKVTGTVHAGGYKNAALLAAQIIGDEGALEKASIERIIKAGSYDLSGRTVINANGSKHVKDI